MLLITLILLALILLLPWIGSRLYAGPRTFKQEDIPSKPAAVVFGAGLTASGRPTPVLRDRVFTAVELYRQGKVRKLLMSGDNRFINYDEPSAMKRYALQLGVPEDDIILDYAGRRTYDTCYRARAIFQLEDVILVTQKFHLPRALYTCGRLGLEALGVPADQRDYHQGSQTYWNLRELPATLVAWLQVHITRPEPVLGTPEPIFPAQD